MLKNNTILITGASRGIGQSCAIKLAKSNARLIIHYNKNRAKAEETLKKLPQNDHMLIQADLSKSEGIQILVDYCIKNEIIPDIIVNNAGIYEELDVASASYEDWVESWEKTIQTNLFSYAHLSFLFARQMMKRKSGKIINISSRGAYRGEPTAMAYGASKAGVNSLTQSLASALAPYNIFAYGIAPGFVDTEMSAYAMQSIRANQYKKQSPLNRIAKPEEVAHAVYMMCLNGNDFMRMELHISDKKNPRNRGFITNAQSSRHKSRIFNRLSWISLFISS